MQTLSIETIAIVEATAPDVRAKSAAITFWMWHHLPTDRARRLLFTEFVLEGRVFGLLEAIEITAGRRWPQPLPRPLLVVEPAESAALYAAMEPVLSAALADVLGRLATGAVLNAWRQAYHFLTAQIHEPENN